MALLARGWGNTIQILAATRVDIGVDDSGGNNGGGVERSGYQGGGRVMWPQLGVAKEISASAPVVAVEWLQEQASFFL